MRISGWSFGEVKRSIVRVADFPVNADSNKNAIARWGALLQASSYGKFEPNPPSRPNTATYDGCGLIFSVMVNNGAIARRTEA
jgi:hypothetical protein